MVQSAGTDAICLWDAKAILGEGPVWDPRDGCLWWVDIKAPAIHRCDPASGGKTSFTPPLQVTALAPRAAGGFVAATSNGFAFVDPVASRYEPFAELEPDRPNNRSNDGKMDGAGNFWAGTMDNREQDASGALYRLGTDRSWQRIDDGYRVTNGPAFSPDGRIMYHTDSALRTIYRFDVARDGGLSGRRPLATFRNEHGYPDGMTVDAEGCLWVAFWDGWAVRQLSADGAILTEHAIPVERPTSVAFGGALLDRLFVTSATVGLNAEALSVQPGAGGLFELVGHGTKGCVTPIFSG